MDPTVRLLELVTTLQRRPGASATALAELLGVTPRTVRRDITRLRDLGYAVDSAPGRVGGYRLRAGSALPPLVLTDDEAVVLAVGLQVAAFSGVSGSGETALSAVAKLEELLPARLRDRVAALGAEVGSLSASAEASTDPAVLASLAVACRRGERVALTYVDAAGTRTRRDVDPYRVVHGGRRWYLVAYDFRRPAWRTFRVDRAVDVELLGGRVTFDDPPDPVALVAESVTTSVYRWTATVRLELSAAQAHNRVPATVGQLVEETATTTTLRIGADDLDWLARYLVGLTCGFEVLEPVELVDHLRDLGAQLAATGPRVAGHS